MRTLLLSLTVTLSLTACPPQPQPRERPACRTYTMAITDQSCQDDRQLLAFEAGWRVCRCMDRAL